MAVQGPFQVVFEQVFPHGLGVVGAVAPMADFDASTRENRVQARDKDTGLPVWVVDVMDFDPDARERTFKVKITADIEPVVPPVVAGTPVRPVVLDGLTVTPYLKEVGNGRQKIAYSLRAASMAAPRQRTTDPKAA
ncbi:hypothetical protein MLP_49370 [Microlunatus phosphovorus NM-1]|uniref:Plasmid replication, integration and excision activator n=1 Tax=Microlunatus phosphovorus (strain ATCC 700054 / DSM 10555 / JCM 9379 / NBRC 101784 / NCIMB 13414 / VKM Ac-1990 / NM-1) TaxID=1032480 RepID=F5XG17_MICPN|nr:hypothetical protein [Microlunatus phosphovorus]BAK37951.1 hypothetical protein MLP_49370 [Microlunatus phosphovorus NM-1]